jgi:hypothetical protein
MSAPTGTPVFKRFEWIETTSGLQGALDFRPKKKKKKRNTMREKLDFIPKGLLAYI